MKHGSVGREMAPTSDRSPVFWSMEKLEILHSPRRATCRKRWVGSTTIGAGPPGTATEPAGSRRPVAGSSVNRTILSSCCRATYMKSVIGASPRELAADQHLLDLVGAVVDLEDPGIPVELLDRVIVREAVAAVDLDGRRTDALTHPRGEELGHRRTLDAPRPGLLERG